MVFYSQLAALWCIQMYRSNTRKNAIQRTVGTLVGASFGLVYLLLYPEIRFEALMVPLGVLLVLYATVILDKKQASYFSCVVFLSIVVNHALDLNPYIFVLNRFLDTIIGIVIGFVINNVHVCINPDRETLFVSGLDDTLLNSEKVLSQFSKVELNRMIDNGMKFTVSTIRTPASLIEPLRDVNLKLPVIAMDGAVLYETKTNSFLKVVSIDSKMANDLFGLIKSSGLCWYSNVIIDDVLIIFYGDMSDKVNNDMVGKLRISPYRNYIKRDTPETEPVVYFMVLDKKDKVEKLYSQVCDLFYIKDLRVVMYESKDNEGYSYLKIYNKDASKEKMLDYLKGLLDIRSSISFGTIEGRYDVIIHNDDADEVVKSVRKMYEPLGIRINHS